MRCTSSFLTWRTAADALARAHPTWPVGVESREPLYRLVGRRPERAWREGGTRGRRAARLSRTRFRLLLHERAEAGDQDAAYRARCDGSAVVAGGKTLAPERAPLWRAHRAQQGGDGRQGRRG